MKTESIQIYPAKTRVVPNIKLIKNVVSHSPKDYQEMLDGEAGGVIEKRNHKKHGKIVTAYTIANADGYDGDDPLNEFDYAVLSVCISEWKEFNLHTTPAIILRGLTGKVGKSDAEPFKNQREAILNSVRKLMSTIITVDLTNTNEKLGYGGEKKLTAPILPCKYITTVINGQPVEDVIHFTDESPILKIAEARNQIIRYDTALLDVPNQNNTPLVIVLKNYCMRRVMEIKAHKMTPTITFDDIFEKAHISDEDRHVKLDARNTVKTLFEHLQSKGVIETFELVKKGTTIYATTFTF